MSAFTVHKAHIDALVTAGAQLGLIAGADTTDVGVMLWEENYHSVNDRYGEHSRPPDYRADLTNSRFHPIAVLCVLACYEHQSCEHPGWPSSKAHQWCQRLQRAALARLPDAMTVMVPLTAGLSVPAYRRSPVWEATPWGVESLADVPRVDTDAPIPAAPPKGFHADILIGPYHAPNGGISARARHVTIVEIDTGNAHHNTNDDTNHGTGGADDTDTSACLPAFARIRTPSADAPAVFLRFEYGRFVARPVEAPPGTAYAASGAFVHSGDSRWRELVGHRLPIPLHDRSENTPID